jgi:hypothetical protein
VEEIILHRIQEQIGYSCHENGTNKTTDEGNDECSGGCHKYQAKRGQEQYARMKPLWTRMQAEMEEDMKAKQDELSADTAKIDFEKMMAEREAEEEASEAERKVDKPGSHS